MSTSPNDYTPEEWKRQKELYCSFNTRYIPEEINVPVYSTLPSESNMVIQIENEKCLDFVFCLIESLKNNDNDPSFPGGLHINPKFTSEINSNSTQQLSPNSFIYLRGTSNLYLPLLTDEISTSVFLNIPKDIEFFDNALSNIKIVNFQNQISDDGQKSLSEKGFLSYPPGNSHFIYLFLPVSHTFQKGSFYQDIANKGCLYALFQYWQRIFPYSIYPNTSSTTYLVLDNFDIIEKYIEGIKNLIDEIKQLNRLGVSVIIITRDNRLKSGPYYEGVFRLYLDIKASHRGKEQINVNLVRSPFDPSNSYRFLKKNGQWQEYHEKYKQYYPQIREAFTRYGMTAVELKDYLKKYFQIDISLAGLSKLLLKLGLRKNKYHKRKRAKGKK